MGLEVKGWHASCQENIEKAMASVGFENIVVPQSINLFMDTPGLEDGRIAWLEAKTKPGDNVVLRAEMDCYLAVSPARRTFSSLTPPSHRRSRSKSWPDLRPFVSGQGLAM